ncbi:hypothetical protein M427DRAFT_142907 [Gonapodya prolifera JEL478]|uniref:Peroxidase n=1 Tax=Gonapodya prolifera (strain JEL478) TaxID=1344416 RepID=A0A139ATM3_GONPJ|nr:hypothetical protein M427DRAFT_142907 [Gonapodya prolifera JEL478]|eukprot:KXS20078.1 hypothetical protein M427DRAFT_142907 [Gonapodya prolifera JEL478]
MHRSSGGMRMPWSRSRSRMIAYAALVWTATLACFGGVGAAVKCGLNDTDWADMRNQIAGLVAGGYGPDFVRITYHDGGSYSMVDGSGGARATLNIVAFPNGTTGLIPGLNTLQLIKERYPVISYADLWAFAGAVAVYESGGPAVAYRCGRVDFKVGEFTDVQNHDRLPQGWSNSSVVREKFSRMGFTDKETVALIGGGHSMGKCKYSTSGFGGAWTDNPFRFTNQFFVLRTSDDTLFHQVTNPNGLTQFNTTDNSKMALPSDHSLIVDPGYGPVIQAYAKNASLFFNDFGAAYAKMSELGSKLSNDNLVNVTGTSGTRLGVATDAMIDVTTADGWKSLVLGSMMMLKWSLRQTDGYIDFRIYSKASGWFAFGLGTGMPSQDVYSYEPATGTITDRVSTTFDMPSPDVSVNGVNNVENFQDLTSTLAQGTWVKVVAFSRKLNTGDSNDAIIAPGATTLTYAWSTDSPSIAYHGANKGKVSLDLFTALIAAQDTDSKVLALQAFHGVTMLFSFGLLLPFGIFVARYSEHYPLVWLQQHEKINTLVFSNVALSALIALVGRLSGGNETLHPILGMILFGLATITVVMGFLIGHYLKIPSTLSRHFSRSQHYLKYLHIFGGYASYLLGLTNGFLGLTDYLTRSITVAPSQRIILLAAYVSSVVSVPAGLYLYHLRKRNKLRLLDEVEKEGAGEKETKHLSTLERKLAKLVEVTWDDFNRQVLEGKRYVVIRDVVYDIGNWMDRHPGGKRILEKVMGTDCTDYFLGSSVPGAVLSGHTHSRVAEFQLNDMACGRIRKEGHRIDGIPSFPRITQDAFADDVFRLMVISDRALLSGPLATTRTYAYTFKFSQPTDVIYFKPGDHVCIQLRALDGKLIERSYTPLLFVARGYFTCVIRIRRTGAFTPLLEKMGPGDVVRIKAMREDSSQNPPVNNPKHPTLCFSKLGLLSSGVGIAPMIQIIDYYATKGPRRRDGSCAFTISLTALFSTEQDVICRDLVEKYATQLGSALQYRFLIRKKVDPTSKWTGLVADTLTIDALREYLPSPPKVHDVAMRVLDRRAMVAVTNERIKGMNGHSSNTLRRSQSYRSSIATLVRSDTLKSFRSSNFPPPSNLENKRQSLPSLPDLTTVAGRVTSPPPAGNLSASRLPFMRRHRSLTRSGDEPIDMLPLIVPDDNYFIQEDDAEDGAEDGTRIIISGNHNVNDQILDILSLLDFQNCVIVLP